MNAYQDSQYGFITGSKTAIDTSQQQAGMRLTSLNQTIDQAIVLLAVRSQPELTLPPPVPS